MNQLPTTRASRRGLTQAAISGITGGSPPQISIRGSRFRKIDAAGNEKMLETLSIDVVIVDANEHVSKIYYREKYDPQAGEYAPPTCFSDNGLAPSTNASEPQSEFCATCPNNAWGSATSAITGKNTKACNDAKKLAVLVVPPEGDIDKIVYLLRIPPNSLKELKAYAQLIGQQKTPEGVACELFDVITRLTFDPEVQQTLNFEAVGWTDDEINAAVDHAWEEKVTELLVGKTDQPRTGALPAPAERRQISAQPEAREPVREQPRAAPPPAPPARGTRASAQQAVEPEVAPAPKRTRRTKAEMEAAAAAPAPQEGMPDIPKFLQKRDAGGIASPEPGAKPAFGIASKAPAPDAKLASALDRAFSLPTKR
jgi:hypothetical protein